MDGIPHISHVFVEQKLLHPCQKRKGPSRLGTKFIHIPHHIYIYIWYTLWSLYVSNRNYIKWCFNYRWYTYAYIHNTIYMHTCALTNPGNTFRPNSSPLSLASLPTWWASTRSSSARRASTTSSVPGVPSRTGWRRRGEADSLWLCQDSYAKLALQLWKSSIDSHVQYPLVMTNIAIENGP